METAAEGQPLAALPWRGGAIGEESGCSSGLIWQVYKLNFTGHAPKITLLARPRLVLQAIRPMQPMRLQPTPDLLDEATYGSEGVKYFQWLEKELQTRQVEPLPETNFGFPKEVNKLSGKLVDHPVFYGPDRGFGSSCTDSQEVYLYRAVFSAWIGRYSSQYSCFERGKQLGKVLKNLNSFWTTANFCWLFHCESFAPSATLKARSSIGEKWSFGRWCTTSSPLGWSLCGLVWTPK